MFESKSKFLYVAGDDLASINLDLELMPKRSDGKLIVGKDVAFLQEAVAERQYAMKGESDGFDYDSKIDWYRLFAFGSVLHWLSSYERPPINCFLNPSLQIPSGIFDETEVADELIPNLGIGVHELKEYRHNYPDLTDDEFYAKPPVVPYEDSDEKIRQNPVLNGFENVKRTVRIYRTSGIKAKSTGDRFALNYFRHYDDGRTEPFFRSYGSTADSFLYQVFDESGVGRQTAPGYPISYKYYVQEGLGYNEENLDEVGLVVDNLPPGCKVTPVVAVNFIQQSIFTPSFGKSQRRWGYRHERQKTAGDEARNRLEWTWRELTIHSFEWWARDEEEGYVPFKWHPAQIRPKNEDFYAPNGQWGAEVQQAFHIEVWHKPVGIIVDLGPHTKWWA